MKIFLLSLSLGLLMCSPVRGDSIKQPNVSGGFYPSDPAQLSAAVEGFIHNALPPALPAQPEMVIAPHAGYIYSGAVAGFSFKAAANRQIKTVVILAPSHFFPLRGISVWNKGKFVTPLGELTVDADFSSRLLNGDDRVVFDPSVFEREHALEVELPFIQKAFPQAAIVPVIMGRISPELSQSFAELLNAVIGDRDDVLVVVSSDLSHYHDDTFARRMDALTLQTVTALAPERLFQGCASGTMEMCGCIPVTTALYLAKARGLDGVEVLRYANSGDVNQDKTRVVGYGAVAFYRPIAVENSSSDVEKESEEADGKIKSLTSAQRTELLKVARQTVEEFVRNGDAPPVQSADPRLQISEGAFVTLREHGRLRGCIGNIISDQPLIQTVRDMAVAAASQDPRFDPVSPEELEGIEVEVSVLSQPWRITDVKQFQPGVHGVIVRRGSHKGVLLPQVATETGWGREEFLSQLCAQKAGLPRDAWKDSRTEIYLFTADVFGENSIPEE